MLKTILTATAITLSALTLSAADTLVIPASGTGPGANGSRWQTEVTLHNGGTDTLNATLTYHDLHGAGASYSTAIAPKSTISIDDIVANHFAQTQSTGAIVLSTDTVSQSKLTATSRTFNLSTAGEFGQDVPAIGLGDAFVNGDSVVINGPSHASTARFNFGLYAVDNTVVDWQLLRRDGTLAATVGQQSYAAGAQVQFSNGVTSLLAQSSQNNDVVVAKIRSGRAFFYGSIIDNQTGDPTYVPGARTRDNILPIVLGVDLNEDGQTDILDANHDNVLDRPVHVSTSSFPTFFRLLASDSEGQKLTYTFVNQSRDIRFVDDNGTIQWFPSSELKGTAGSLIVRVSDGTDSVDFTIPVVFE